MNERFAKRFKELKDNAPEFRTTLFGGSIVVSGQWQGWATSAHSLIQAVFGLNSPQALNFAKAYKDTEWEEEQFPLLFSLFLAAKSDFEGGHVFNIELKVSGEVFGDFVNLARQALSDGNKDVAAVLSCAALEDALKRFGHANNLAVEGKTMTEVINALKTAGLVAGAQKTLLDAMPRIRNLALHGDWAKLSEPDVASVLGFVESFLLTKFSDG